MPILYEPFKEVLIEMFRKMNENDRVKKQKEIEEF
jgi:hypothetical protein